MFKFRQLPRFDKLTLITKKKRLGKRENMLRFDFRNLNYMDEYDERIEYPLIYLNFDRILDL